MSIQGLCFLGLDKLASLLLGTQPFLVEDGQHPATASALLRPHETDSLMLLPMGMYHQVRKKHPRTEGCWATVPYFHPLSVPVDSFFTSQHAKIHGRGTPERRPYWPARGPDDLPIGLEDEK